MTSQSDRFVARLGSVWNRFFFEPVRPETLGLFRIALGGVAALSLIGRFQDRALLYGAEGLMTQATALRLFSRFEPGRFLLLAVPGADPWLAVFLLVVTCAALLLALGVASKASNLVLFLGLCALSNRNLASENSGDDLIRIQCFFLLFTPSGAALSVDRLRARGRAREAVSPWGLRLIQLQTAYVYLDTVFLKLHGAAWLDGTAVYYALNYVELKRLSLGPLVSHLWEIRLATWATLVMEFAAGALVWFKPLRYPVLAAAIVMHLVFNLALQFPVFQYAMIACLVIFIEPKDVEFRLNRAFTKVSKLYLKYVALRHNPK